jgi:hypothetical protein
MNRLLVPISFVLLVLAPAVHAADIVSFSFSGCTDARDHPVRNQADPNLPALLETRMVEGNRVIFYNPTLFPELQPETRAFLYAHECAWTRLGLPINTERTEENAHRADCWAVETLSREKLIKNAAALDAIEGDLALIADKQAQLPGPARTLKLASCPFSPAAVSSKPVRGNVLDVDKVHPASPVWSACVQGCGNRLYTCGRSSTCVDRFNQCSTACNNK